MSHVFRSLSLKREVSIGDLLTVTTITISLISVLVSWSVDRNLRRSTEANTIRTAAAGVLGELERSRDLFLSLYPQTQAIIVETSEIVTSVDGDKPRRLQVQKARDFIWKRLNDVHNVITLKLMEERIDSGYIRLFPYYPSIRTVYQTAVRNLRATDAEMLAHLLRECEARIMSFADSRGHLYSALVGNSLRAAASEVESQYRARFASALKPAEAYLLQRIEAADSALLNRQK
jgi:hypothetical protein